jgi:hypothetical protein
MRRRGQCFWEDQAFALKSREIVHEHISAEPCTDIVTKFATTSMKNMIRAMTRIVHLNLGNPLSTVVARTMSSHTQ